MADKSKTTPIPVRLDEEDVELLARLQSATGINRSEIIRRAVHYALTHAQETGSLNHLFGDEAAIREALQGSTTTEADARFSYPPTPDSPFPLVAEPSAPPFCPSAAPPASPGDSSLRSVV